MKYQWKLNVYFVGLSFPALLLTTISATHHYIQWTPKGVQNYSSDHPLHVQIGDILIFACDRGRNYSEAIVFVEQTTDLYDECDCVVPLGFDNPHILGRCHGQLDHNDIVIHIKSSDARLSAIFSYLAGMKYHYKSCFENHCNEGLKMAIYISDLNPSHYYTTDLNTSINENITSLATTGSNYSGILNSSNSTFVMKYLSSSKPAVDNGNTSSSYDHPAQVKILQELLFLKTALWVFITGEQIFMIISSVRQIKQLSVC